VVITAGSLSFDYIFNFPGRFSEHIMPEKIHLLNLSFLTNKLHKNFGGTAGNISYSLALLKEETSVLATAGKDFKDYQDFLKQSGVETKYIKVYNDEFTSNYFVLVDKRDNQIGGFYSGAMENASELSLDLVKDKPEFMIISPTVPEAMIKFSSECREKSIPYMFDPGMQLPRLKKDQLLKGIKGCEILIGNDYEIGLIQKKLHKTLKQLLKISKIIVTTLGNKGSIIRTRDKIIRIKPAKVKSNKDPVGAGDAYRAGFVKGYVNNLDLKTCGQMGATTAVYTVEKYGTTTHSFDIEDFQKRYYKNFKKKLILERKHNDKNQI